MRTTSLAAALALLIVGCGIDPAPTAPEEPGLTLSEPEIAAAVVATNLWTTKAPMPTARGHSAAGVVNGVLYTVGGYTGGGATLATVEA
jgi:hypothetical protein